MNRRMVTLLAAALGAVLLAVFFWGDTTGNGEVSADAPHPGLDFSMGIDTDGDTTDDCDSSGSPTDVCVLPDGSQFAVNVYLHDIADIPDYRGYDVVLLYEGVLAKYTFDPDFWPGCDFSAITDPVASQDSHDWDGDGVGDPFVGFGCVSALPPLGDGPSTYTGLLATTDFDCVESGEITMVHGITGPETMGATSLTENVDVVHNVNLVHAEGIGTTETLTVDCVEAPAPTVPSVGGVGVLPDAAGTDASGGPAGIAIVAAGAGALALCAAASYARRRWLA